MDTIIKLNAQTCSAVPTMFARAYFDDPLLVYLAREDESRERRLTHLFRYIINYGATHGELYASSGNTEAAALWLAPGTRQISPGNSLFSGALGLPFKLGPGMIKRMLRFDGHAARCHKRCLDEPHYYLFCLASDPDKRGGGHAKSLMNAMIPRLDNEGFPCFLETNNQVNVSYYENFGFAVIEHSLIPGTNVGHWGMVRHP